jgi:hypothetical protein
MLDCKWEDNSRRAIEFTIHPREYGLDHEKELTKHDSTWRKCKEQPVERQLDLKGFIGIVKQNSVLRRIEVLIVLVEFNDDGIDSNLPLKLRFSSSACCAEDHHLSSDGFRKQNTLLALRFRI